MIERQLQTAVNNIVKWCDSNGHSISASKSCCVHFCRKRGIHPDPDIRIRDVQIPVVPDVRFLGVIFDRRLTFLPHILHLRKRCEKSLNLLKVLSNTSWGRIEHHYSECIRQSRTLSHRLRMCCIRISVQLYSEKT
ncbi:putative RNA-directed DNA polymerase from transposon X-element [Trichonephila clavipes]|nr:putative RNA-directed DNA polymerase from transposon X-element [Trichonephila clavipes]